MFDLRIDGVIARLTLSRAEARNAIPVAGWAELARLASAAVTRGARVLIVAGAPGGGFCAGADIADFDGFQRNDAARSAFREAIREGLDRLAGLPIATIAMVDGACYGAGVALAMACDVRIAGEDARFAITPAKLGISYPQEDVRRLVSLVGPGQAARLLLSAESIDAAEAERIGLIEMRGGAAVAEVLAGAIAGNDAESVRALKRGIGLAARGIGKDAGQDRSFDDLLGSPALAERLARHRDRAR